MKIGAMVPQGWRMDLNGIKPEKQWDTILEASTKIEKLNLSLYGCMIISIQYHHLLKILHSNVGH